MNFNFSVDIISSLLRWGVQEFYICAGLRNIPIIEILLQSNEYSVFSHFEERSAAFYALGRIKSLKKPVAIIVTSGTAAGELLPAVMEAYYSGLPLVVVTADRPRKQRGTGAPQTAEQRNLFGIYVSACIDIEAGEDFEIDSYPPNRPLHINPCFDIPLQSNQKINFSDLFNQSNSLKLFPYPKKNHEEVVSFIEFLNQAKNLFVIVSQLDHQEVKMLVPFLIQLGVPIYLESISNIREQEELSNLKIISPDRIWKTSEKAGFHIDSVLKIGGTPTHRIWRELDETKTDINIFSISNNIFPGSYRAKHISTNLNHFIESNWSFIFSNKLELKNQDHIQKFMIEDLDIYHKTTELFNKYPKSEQSLIHNLSRMIKCNSRVYLGNSLPIRTWDFAAIHKNKNLIIEASRGLNGIDGQVSTFLGFAENEIENWAILGDLTTLYDQAGLWALQYRPNLNINIVVVNNGGGMIFKGILSGKSAQGCQNTHSLNFKNWAEMWGMEYELWDRISLEEKNILNVTNRKRVIELVPDRTQTDDFLKEYQVI